MASVAVYPDRVIVRLSAAEKALALRRKDLVLDRSAITSALITDDPWVWLRGVRAPGAHIPGKLSLGTWRGEGGKEFVLVRGGRPAVVLDFARPGAGASEPGDGAGSAGDPASAADAEGSPDGGETPAGSGTPEFDDFARVVLSTAHAAELIRALRIDDVDAVFAAGA
jgi:hypothetical protein